METEKPEALNSPLMISKEELRRQKHRERNRKYYQTNKEKFREYSKENYQKTRKNVESI